ncbi:MAG: TraB/GumN family protein [Sphingomonadales bacterium]|nr:TraB/GumN family protein [Sphingomonadales bacterium]
MLPELAQSLLYNRNANWTAWVEKRLQKPGTVFVAVGAGHLAGPDSVVALLTKEKLKVERVQ